MRPQGQRGAADLGRPPFFPPLGFVRRADISRAAAARSSGVAAGSRMTAAGGLGFGGFMVGYRQSKDFRSPVPWHP
jgi:hypothetical protein